MQQNIDSQHNEICRLNRNAQILNKELRLAKKKITVLESNNTALRERLSIYEHPLRLSENYVFQFLNFQTVNSQVS